MSYQTCVVTHQRAREEDDLTALGGARRFRYGTSAAPLAARHPGRLRHVRLTRPRPFALARVLEQKGVPRRVALLWTAQSVAQTARGVGNLAGAYGIGVLWGKIRGLPTISPPSIRERNQTAD